MVSARHLCGSLLGGSALSRGLPTGRFIHLPHLLPLRLDSSPDKEFSLPSPGMVGSSQVTNEQTKAPREYANMAAATASHTHSCIHKQTLASCCVGITVLGAGDARPCLGELII